MEIESQEVLQLIQQYLKENNLTKSYEALKEETNSPLNLVEDINQFQEQIQNGQWDNVLQQIQQWNIKPSLLVDLYEQIFLELLELKEVHVARSLLRQTEPLNKMRNLDQNRYLRLENLLSRTFLDLKDLYPSNTNKQKRRNDIAKNLLPHLTVAPPSRLLTLLNQALKYQQQAGLLPLDTAYDLFQGIPKIKVEQEEQLAMKPYLNIKFPKKQHPESILFSKDGLSIFTGSTDGFIEVWNINTGKLRKDLKYQFENTPMLMDSTVLCLALNQNNDTLIAGDQNGNINLFQISTGRMIKKFSNAHGQGCTSISFILDDTKILSTGFDSKIKVFGLKSNKKIKEFNGHTSFVNKAIMNQDNTKVISVASEGTIRIWDYKSTECIKIIKSDDLSLSIMSFNNNSIGGIPLFKILKVPNQKDHFIVGSSSNSVHAIDVNGKVINKLQIDKKEIKFIDLAISAKGKFIYTLDNEGIVYCFDSSNFSLVNQFKGIENRPIGIISHPISNYLLVYGENNIIPIYKN